MLFNSYSFLLAFLPITLVGYWLVGRLAGGPRGPLWWLVVCSVVFYAVWNPKNLLIIGPSLLANYVLSRAIQRQMAAGPQGERRASALLALGIVGNLALIGYFKYRNFFVDSINHLAGTQWPLLDILLPLGISFITFQKIAFLVDVRTGHVKDFQALDYLFFVLFFPQLIAGPIVHYRELAPQFRLVSGQLAWRDLAIGGVLFSLGLFKKTILADGIAPFASGVYRISEAGGTVGLFDAWLGVAAFTLQVYFDFSGYSDMATGLARMFGVKLPINFDSPLKASSIIDFWSRWHMTLTRFLQAYVYTPISLAVTRRRMAAGKPMISRKQAPLGAFAMLVAMPTLVTFLISGLWHGAGINFVLYGAIHGAYMVVNHAWRQWRPQWPRERYDRVMRPLGLVITLAAVFFAMSLFRSETLAGALNLMGALLGQQGVSLPAALMSRLGPVGDLLQGLGVTASMASGGDFLALLAWVVVLLVLALATPNTLQMMADFEPVLGAKKGAAPGLRIRLDRRWALVSGAALAGGLLSLNSISAFLYWQF